MTLAMILAVATHDPADPSWNNATSGSAVNALGAPGAVFADLMLQTVGPVALLMLVVPFCLSIRIVVHRMANRNWIRLLTAILSGVLAALVLGGLADVLDLTASTAGGLIGVGGEAIALSLPPQFGIAVTGVSVFLLVAALMALAWASAVPPVWLALPFTGVSRLFGRQAATEEADDDAPSTDERAVIDAPAGPKTRKSAKEGCREAGEDCEGKVEAFEACGKGKTAGTGARSGHGRTSTAATVAALRTHSRRLSGARQRRCTGTERADAGKRTGRFRR